MRAYGLDRGASAAEYVGLIVLAAMIVGTLVAIGIPGKVRTHLTPALCRIVGTDCGRPADAGSPRAANRPETTAPGKDPGFLHSLGNTLDYHLRGFASFTGFGAPEPAQQQKITPFNDGIGIVSELWQQAKGVGSFAKMTWCATGLCTDGAVKEARDGWSYIWHHPGEAAKQAGYSIVEPCVKTWREKDQNERSYWSGRCFTSIVTTVVGAKGLGKLGKLAKGGKAVSKVAKLAKKFGPVATKLEKLGLSAEQIERLLSKLDPRLRKRLERLTERAAGNKDLAALVKKTLGDLDAADRSGRLDPTSFHSLMSRMTDPKASPETIQGVASEIAAARRVIESGDLAPGTKVVTHASAGKRVDLGDGKPVDVAPVNQADLVYKDANGVVHVAEVKNAAVSLANKIAKDPNQFANLRAWARADPGRRRAEVVIDSERKWTDLFGEPVRGQPDIMKQIIDAKVPLKIAGRPYSPKELKTLRNATDRKLRAWKREHPDAKDGDFFKQPQMSTIDSAKRYLGIP